MSEKDTVLRRPEENGAKTTVFVSFTGAHGTFDGQECSSEYPQQKCIVGYVSQYREESLNHREGEYY